MEQATESLDKLNKVSEKTEHSTISLDDIFNKLSPSALASCAGISALYKAFQQLTGSISQFTQQAIGMYSHFEKVQTGLSGILGDAQKGADMFEQLRQFSFETTFGVDELADATTQLLQASVGADEVTKKLTQLGNVAGGDKQKFAELVTIFAKINNTGKAGAMQLQQLALRGVPIYQMLKEMGVQGTASAKDISEAFEKMTEQGGMFYNTMNNINETIEGKRGFVDDTLKEVQANFAGASGSAEVFKTYLDIARAVLEKINDTLAKINENPILKALFQGALVASITGLATVIGVALVLAFKKLNTQLAITATLKNALSGGVGLAIAGIAGGVALATGAIVAGVGIVNANMDESKKKIKELNKQVKEAQSTVDSNGSVENQLNLVNSKMALAEEQIKQAKKELQGLKGDSANDTFNAMIIEEYENELKALEVQKQNLEYTYKRNEGRQKTLEYFKKQNELLQEYEDYVSGINDANFGDTIESQMQEIQNTLTQLESINKKGGLVVVDESGKQYFKSLSDEAKKQIDKNTEYLQEKLNDLRIELKISNLQGWQKDLQKALGFSDEKTVSMIDNGGFTTVRGVDEFIRGLDETSDKLLYFKDALGTSEIEQLENKIKSAQSALEYLVTSENYEGTEDSLVYFANLIDEYTQELERLKESTKEVTDVYGDMIKQAISGTDVGNLSDAFGEGADVKSVILKSLLNAVISVVGGIDGMQVILNPIKEFMKAFEPLFKTVLVLLLGFVKILSMVGEVLMNILNALTGGFFDKMSGIYDEMVEANDKEDDKKDLIDALEQLKDQIEKQEQYYLKQKQNLSAQASLSVTPVNDMIITDKGVFSTSPQDTIMAMKEPTSLLGAGNVTMNVKIENTASDTVEVQAQHVTNEEGLDELLINISKKIGLDVANGFNGWDKAYASQQSRLSGRRITV